jgi:adenylate kinase
MVLRTHDDVVLLLGAPGAGKGTQARLLAAELGVPHVASGDLLREHRRRGTPLGKAVQGYMDRGDLVPDAVVLDMIEERMHEPDVKNGVLLDGFPRTLAQADALDERLARTGGAVRSAVYMEVPAEVLVERLGGRWMCRDCDASYHEVYNPSPAGSRCGVCGGELYQRADDRRDVVANRIAVYLRDTLPVIEHYASLGVLHRVDGKRSIEEVRRDLLAAVGLDRATLTYPAPTAPARVSSA